MEILGMWVGEQEDDLFVWMRRFKSEADRERLYEAVYQSDHWKEKIAPKYPGHARPRAGGDHAPRAGRRFSTGLTDSAPKDSGQRCAA